MTVLRHRRPSLAHWHDDELVMGPMAVLACWRDNVGCKVVLAHSLAKGRRYSLVQLRLARQRIPLWPSSCVPWTGRQDPRELGGASNL